MAGEQHGVVTLQWPELFTGPWTVTGNIAKVKVLQELHRLLANGSQTRVLDIGCIGPSPLQFWKPLLGHYSFHLTGVDVHGIDRAQAIIGELGWQDWVTLKNGSGYDLTTLFAPDSFDLVVATQVLEHVARLPHFLNQVATVLRPGGEAFFSLDSAHPAPRFALKSPVRFVKNGVKKALSLIGHERHYDLPWFDYEVADCCRSVGLEVLACRYYNLAPLKLIHNRLIPPERQNAIARQWFDLEEMLNEEETVRKDARHLFLGIYFHVRKSPKRT